jgi:hydroxyethylthiazole kinase-like uncharacterized protein yjeF
MKILNSEQMHALDELTIKSEDITSLELMERAAGVCARSIIDLAPAGASFDIYCGMGNNGGDGLVIARLLMENNVRTRTFLVRFREQMSPDAEASFKTLQKLYPATITEITKENDLDTPEKKENRIAIDALLGTGTSKNKNTLLEECIKHLNKTYSQIISIDVPSGLMPDGPQHGQPIIESTLTLTFESPKLAFLLPENASYVRNFEVLDIGLSKDELSKTKSEHFFVTGEDARSLYVPRQKFSHKGDFGHALLLAGGRGKSGAALMAAEACLRSGAGLLTLHSTPGTLAALNVRLPEAMSSVDANEDHITEVNRPERFDALAFGPGTGTAEATQIVLKKILHFGIQNLVIDADGLNILSENKTWLEFLPPGTILTPHPGEFERLVGKQDDDLHKLKALKQFSSRYDCIVILKGAHTCVAMPDGNLFFNSTGNSGLAKGGTGDVLTGVIVGLLSSGYNPPKAALLGVFLHGLAADLCAKEMGLETILATDVVRALPAAFRALAKKNV